jgi:hypothetical protein
METTGISIDKESWALLREEPLYSARFIDRSGTDELALVVRVEALDWFFEMQPPVLLDLASWRSPQGVWVVVVSYQLHANFGGPKGGSFYVNPRQVTEAELLRKLTRQESLPVIFLSEDCASHYTSKVMLDPQALMTWRLQIEEIQQGLKDTAALEGDDKEFAAAVRTLSMQEEE